MSKTISVLEADLRRVRRDAEVFGRDLKALRAEKDKLEAQLRDELAKGERAKKQSSTEVKLLNEQLETQKRKLQKALEEFEDHVCGGRCVVSRPMKMRVAERDLFTARRAKFRHSRSSIIKNAKG